MSATEALSPALDARLRRQFEAEPAYGFVGLRLLELAPGTCTTRTPVRPCLLHHRGAVQGGIVGMIADATAGYAALAAAGEGDVATLEFKISYYRPAEATSLLCRAETAHRGGGVIFCQARVFADEAAPEALVAEASLTFRRLRAAPVDETPSP